MVIFSDVELNSDLFQNLLEEKKSVLVLVISGTASRKEAMIRTSSKYRFFIVCVSFFSL